MGDYNSESAGCFILTFGFLTIFGLLGIAYFTWGWLGAFVMLSLVSALILLRLLYVMGRNAKGEGE